MHALSLAFSISHLLLLFNLHSPALFLTFSHVYHALSCFLSLSDHSLSHSLFFSRKKSFSLLVILCHIVHYSLSLSHLHTYHVLSLACSSPPLSRTHLSLALACSLSLLHALFHAATIAISLSIACFLSHADTFLLSLMLAFKHFLYLSQSHQTSWLVLSLSIASSHPNRHYRLFSGSLLLAFSLKLTFTCLLSLSVTPYTLFIACYLFLSLSFSVMLYSYSFIHAYTIPCSFSLSLSHTQFFTPSLVLSIIHTITCCHAQYYLLSFSFTLYSLVYLVIALDLFICARAHTNSLSCSLSLSLSLTALPAFSPTHYF